MERVMLSVALLLYGQMLRLYPRHFRTEFEAEMRVTFAEAATRALRHGAFAFLRVCVRELVGTPAALLDAHRFRQGEHSQQDESPVPMRADGPEEGSDPVALLRELDGRTSWSRAGLEVSLFVVTGLLLILVTYLPVPGRQSVWHGLGITAMVALPVVMFVFGLARGLPRWAYPSGGMLLGYSFLAASQFRLVPFLGASVLAALLLVWATVIVNSRYRPLPLMLRHIGQRVWADWMRLSFGLYGLMPLAITLAFDDTHDNGRTPYLACAVVAMLFGAFIHCRSQRRVLQIAALLAGMSLSLGMAVLDQAYFKGGLVAWATALSSRFVEVGWVVELWACLLALLLAPCLIGLARRAVKPAATP